MVNIRLYTWHFVFSKVCGWLVVYLCVYYSVYMSFFNPRCPYEATQTSHLKRHMETHDVIKRYMCQHCTYSSNTLVYLKIHYARRHKGYSFSQRFVDNYISTQLPLSETWYFAFWKWRTIILSQIPSLDLTVWKDRNTMFEYLWRNHLNSCVINIFSSMQIQIRMFYLFSKSF